MTSKIFASKALPLLTFLLFIFPNSKAFPQEENNKPAYPKNDTSKKNSPASQTKQKDELEPKYFKDFEVYITPQANLRDGWGTGTIYDYFISRLNHARLVPDSHAYDRGTIDFKDAIPPIFRGATAKYGADVIRRRRWMETEGGYTITNELATWELENSQENGESQNSSDTEIVGGNTKPPAAKTTKSATLLIKHSGKVTETGTQNSISHEIQLEYQLSVKAAPLGVDEIRSYDLFGFPVGNIRVTYFYEGKQLNGGDSAVIYKDDGSIEETFGSGGKHILSKEGAETWISSEGKVERGPNNKSYEAVRRVFSLSLYAPAEAPPRGEELAYVENACGSKENSSRREAMDVAKKDANPLGETALSVNGKEFQIQVLEWDRPTASADPGEPVSRIYLPKGENYYDRGMRFANELGNLITDARDGKMDFSFSSRDGKPIGLLGSEAISDSFSSSWASYQLGEPNTRFPFADYAPKDSAANDFFRKQTDDPAQRLSPSGILNPFADLSWSRAQLVSGRDEYLKRAATLQKAEALAKDGKVKEAYKLLLSENDGKFANYACSALDSYRFHHPSSK